ncbi:MAG: AAA family ATPase [Marinagarivorans sp.]|nr:AAA family ATPase [Marinagarivorans sp.]
MAGFGSRQRCPICSKNCWHMPSGVVHCNTHKHELAGTLLNGYIALEPNQTTTQGRWLPTALSGWQNRRKNNGPAVYALGSLGPSSATLAALAAANVEPKAVGKPARVDLNRRAEQFAQWSWSKSLDDRHRAAIALRGIDNDAIAAAAAAGIFWSVDKGDNPRHDSLPGNWDGQTKSGADRSGYQGYPGFAIACQQYRLVGDQLEAIVLGAQVATDAAAADKLAGSVSKAPKYAWCSTAANPARIAQFQKFADKGELPITVHLTGNDEARHAVITEGTLKPWVALQRAEIHGIDLGKAVLGAASSRWDLTAFCQIKEQCKLLGITELRLALDGGATINDKVLAGVEGLSKRCEANGLKFRVIWYGQHDKKNAAGVGTDIDELVAPAAYQLLTWAELKPLCPVLAMALDNSRSNVTASPGFFADYGYMPDYAKILFPAMRSARLLAIVAPCGTGKTQLVKAYLKWLAETEAEEAYVLAATHRNALGEALGELLGLPITQELSVYGDHFGSVLTIDSAHQKSAARFSAESVPAHARVFIDEADQVADHMVAAQTAIKHVRTECIENICAAGNKAQQVILVSAGLTDLHIETYRRAFGITDAESFVIENTHQRDMGKAYRCTEAAEVFFRMDEAFKNAERFIAKLSGQQDKSKYSTQTIHRWAQYYYPSLRGLVLDSETCNDPSNPSTYIPLPADPKPDGDDGALCCALTLVTDDNGTQRVTPVMQTVRILSYLNHADPAERHRRQVEIFSQYDYVLHTNTCSTGISFECGDFKLMFQIENGAGSIDDCMQSTARYRPTDVTRYIFAKPTVPAPYGNGSTTPEALRAGQNKNWESYILSLVSADVDFLPDDSVLIGGNVGRIWRDYSLRMQAKRNAEAAAYADGFFDLLRQANYKIEAAFIGGWEALDKAQQLKFKDAISAMRDLSADLNDVETSSVNIDAVDIKKLEAKHQRTRIETQQVTKARAAERYGLDPDEVTPAIIKEEKNGLYLRLLNRLYLSLGTQRTAARDSAKAKKMAAKGRTWVDDILRGAHGHKVHVQQEVGLTQLYKYLSTPGADGQLPTINAQSPQVCTVIELMKANYDSVKNTLGITPGKKITIFGQGDEPDTYLVEVAKPMTLIKSLLKQLHLDIRSVSRSKDTFGKYIHNYRLIDKLIMPAENGELLPLIDYEKFASIRQKIDDNLILGSKTALNAETVDTTAFQPSLSTDSLSTDPYNRYITASTILNLDSQFATQALKQELQNQPVAKLDSLEIKNLGFRLNWCQTSAELSAIRAQICQNSVELWQQFWDSLSSATQSRLTGLAA